MDHFYFQILQILTYYQNELQDVSFPLQSFLVMAVVIANDFVNSAFLLLT